MTTMMMIVMMSFKRKITVGKYQLIKLGCEIRKGSDCGPKRSQRDDDDIFMTVTMLVTMMMMMKMKKATIGDPPVRL